MVVKEKNTKQEHIIPRSSSFLYLQDRAKMAKNDCGRQLFELMARKKSNLSVAADVEKAEDVVKLADQVRR